MNVKKYFMLWLILLFILYHFWRRFYQIQIVDLRKVHSKHDAKSIYICNEIND